MTLARHLRATTVDALLDTVARNFPSETLDARKRALLAEIATKAAK